MSLPCARVTRRDHLDASRDFRFAMSRVVRVAKSLVRPATPATASEARGGDDVASPARESGAALYVADSEESFRRAFYEALGRNSTAIVEPRVTR